MPEWLAEAFRGDKHLNPMVVLSSLVLSLVLGLVVAGVYSLFLGWRQGERGTLPTTLVMLTVLVALVTQVIGESTARAFGLVGALSIVRFRTIVEDTRDTAFVIFAVVVGMAVGAGYPLLGLAGIPAVTVAAFLMWVFGQLRRRDTTVPAVLTVRLGLGHPPEVLREVFAKHVSNSRLTGTATARQGAALELTYAVRLRSAETMVPLLTELNRLDGVQNVEMRQT